MRSWYVPAVFMFALGFGLWVNDRAWNGQVFVYVGEQRAPAAVRSLVDYSSMERKALYRSAHNQLLEHAEVLKRDGFIGVRLGHPLVNRKGGGKEFGCQVQDHPGVFDRIEIKFIGTGISESGEPARMTVEAHCQSLNDLNLLDVIWIPVSDIFASEPKDTEIQSYGDNPVLVRMESIPNQWPENWVLWSIRLYSNDNPDNVLVLDTPLLKEARPTLLSFDWKRSTP